MPDCWLFLGKAVGFYFIFGKQASSYASSSSPSAQFSSPGRKPAGETGETGRRGDGETGRRGQALRLRQLRTAPCRRERGSIPHFSSLALSFFSGDSLGVLWRLPSIGLVCAGGAQEEAQRLQVHRADARVAQLPADHHELRHGRRWWMVVMCGGWWWWWWVGGVRRWW